jgi:xanthine phosphoribosyltransferase
MFFVLLYNNQENKKGKFMIDYLLTYEQVADAAEQLSNQLTKNKHKIKRLVAISRGGLIPTCLLAQHLNISEIHSLALHSYLPDGTQGDITVLVKPNVPDEPETLFVDDLVDGGKTATYLKQTYPNSSFLPLFSKKTSTDFVAPPCLVPQNANVIFPWELKTTKNRARDR